MQYWTISTNTIFNEEFEDSLKKIIAIWAPISLKSKIIEKIWKSEDKLFWLAITLNDVSKMFEIFLAKRNYEQWNVDEEFFDIKPRHFEEYSLWQKSFFQFLSWLFNWKVQWPKQVSKEEIQLFESIFKNDNEAQDWLYKDTIRIINLYKNNWKTSL
jgi:hypothetical protein